MTKGVGVDINLMTKVTTSLDANIRAVAYIDIVLHDVKQQGQPTQPICIPFYKKLKISYKGDFIFDNCMLIRAPILLNELKEEALSILYALQNSGYNFMITKVSFKQNHDRFLRRGMHALIVQSARQCIQWLHFLWGFGQEIGHQEMETIQLAS